VIEKARKRERERERERERGGRRKKWHFFWGLFTLALSQGLHYTLWCVVALLLLVVVIRCGPCGARLFSEGRQSERNGRLDYHETTEEADVRPAIGLPWCCDVVRSYRARLLVCTTTRRKIGRVSTVPEKC
jgi:hypothetical protein